MQVAFAAIIVRAARACTAAATSSAIANCRYRQRYRYLSENGKHTGIGLRRGRRTTRINGWIVGVVEDWINQSVELFGSVHGALVGCMVAGGVNPVGKQDQCFASLDPAEMLLHDIVHRVVEVRAQTFAGSGEGFPDFLPISCWLTLNLY